MLEGHTDTPQLNNTPQLLAEYIQVGGGLCALRAQGWGMYIVHFLRYVFLLDIFCQHLWGVVHLGGVDKCQGDIVTVTIA